jgi:hypothetical protein
MPDNELKTSESEQIEIANSPINDNLCADFSLDAVCYTIVKTAAADRQ